MSRHLPAGSPREPIKKEVLRIAEALRSAIRLSGVSHRHIERELGMSTGYLSRILAGQVELRLGHVLAVCELTGLPPGNFFASLFPVQAPAAQPGVRLAQGLARLHPGTAPTSAKERVIQALLRCCAELEAELRSGGEDTP